jgi:hypothetical protein
MAAASRILELLFFLAGAFGLAYIVGHSTISLPFRRWLGGTPELPPTETSPGMPAVPGALGPVGDFLCEMLECPACFGFWIGLVGGSALFFDAVPWPQRLGWSFWLGCVTSGHNFMMGRWTRLI